jgi:hypothetical protein
MSGPPPLRTNEGRKCLAFVRDGSQPLVVWYQVMGVQRNQSVRSIESRNIIGASHLRMYRTVQK